MDPELREPRYRDVLVAFDGSAEAWLALEHAVLMAHLQRTRITLLTVVAEPPPMLGPAPVGREQLAEEIRTEMNRELARARDALPDDVSVTTVLRVGDAPGEICRVASERGCDAILLGTRGRGRIGALLGSVSQAVLHRARTTVIVVHAVQER